MTHADPSDPRAWLQRARSNLLLADKGKLKKEALELAAKVVFWAETAIS